MSAIAILDYGGANELFNQMTALAQQGRADYQLYYNEEESNEHADMDPMVCSIYIASICCAYHCLLFVISMI